MKKIAMLFAVLASVSMAAQTNGGITPEMLTEIQKGYEGTAADKAIRNAINTTAINVLSANAENAAMIDTEFSDRVKTKGITDQKSSGRCWLFTGLNVLRAAAIEKYDLGEFQFSQNYCFFWDQLEKANLFLQTVIDTREKPFDDREVDWLFEHPISDGGTFTGVANLVTKYGVVPASEMPETFVANSTSQMSTHLKNLLRQDGLKLRETPAGVKAKALPEFLQKQKTQMLAEVYHVLAICLGVPPTEFVWKGKTYTPVEFYQELLGYDLEHNYVMLMNDPSREYGKVYEIEYDRHVYDGDNWLYVNLPIERIKEMAIASIKANTAMYFSCDVAKFLNRDKGVADLANFDYGSLLGVDFTMDKKERVMTHASGSSHAMTLIAVDIKDGKPVKWMVENSWGEKSGYKGNIIMTDEWFDEYMFRLVVEKRFVPADVMKMMEQEPIMLPAWDPMFLGEESTAPDSLESPQFLMTESTAMHPKAPSVPLSVEFAGECIDLTDPDRYERMDRELLTFTYMHTNTTLILKRAPKYFPIIEPILKKNGIPDDLKYLMVIESNLDPKAVSGAGAAGLWQFMKTAGKEYSLEIREGVDERFNIEKETEAACKYLKNAYAKFGDWMTVAASYNAGVGGISKRLEQQHQSCALDLWTVEETARYMYRILAAKMLFESPESFGFNIPFAEKYRYREPSDVVTVSTSIESLVSFAEEHGTTYAKLKTANLWLRDNKLDNPAGKAYKIIIP